MNQKIRIEIAVGLIVVSAILLSVYFFNISSQISTYMPSGKTEVVCSMEAKLCSDGSYVSRTGTNCEFTACPGMDASADVEKSRIANPASINCTQEGGQLEIRTGADGGQVGFCKFVDGSECEEWQFFQGECKSGNKITVEFPLANAEIYSPIFVSGQARGTWFFEGSFPVEVYDSNNKLLGSSAINFIPKSADDTWMTENFVNFSGNVKFNQPTTASGYLLFKKDNPSGNPAMDELSKLPVKFKKYLSMADWKIYRNEKYRFEFKYPKEWSVPIEYTNSNYGSDHLTIRLGCPKVAMGGEGQCPLNLIISQAVIPEELLTDEYFSFSGDLNGRRGDVSYKMINDIKTINFINFSDYPGNDEYTTFFGDKNNITFHRYLNANSSGYDQIISTFKFTK